MSNTIDPIVIDKHGVSVAGHQLRGVTRWSARHEPERGVFEVQLTLVTSKFHADLDEGDWIVGPMRGAYAAVGAREGARVATNTLIEMQISAPAGPTAGPIGASKGTRHPDGSVETKHYGPAAEVSQ